MRAKVAALVAAPWFDRAIIALIGLNAITLGLETYPAVMSRFGGFLTFVDQLILAVFVGELVLRLVANFRGFWRDPWRIFDFAVVAVALIPASGAFSVLRAFRILRVLRLISSVPAMRRVVAGLLEALPGMGSIILLLGLIFYVFSVISTKLFAAAFPEWFGSLGASAYTLFQIITLESWSMGIVSPVMDHYPYEWLLFVAFIIATAFTVLNLFIGVIVDAMQSEHEAEARGEREEMMRENEAILSEIRAMRADLAKMQEDLRKGP